MDYSFNIVVSMFYITAGYMLVAAIVTASVTVVARKLNNKIAYGSLALLSLAGAGYQISTAVYYQTTSIQISHSALIWQMDFATVGLIAAYLFIAFESLSRPHPLRVLAFASALMLAMIIGNHTSGFSLHMDRVIDRVQFDSEALQGLSYLVGEPGVGARVWYGIMAAVLIWGIGVAHDIWREISRRRAVQMVIYILMLSASLVACFYIDWGLWVGFYPLGFAFTFIVAMLSGSLVMESSRRSQTLALRDRQMQLEMQERKRVEQKLQRLSQVFMQEPSPIHITDMDGNTLLVNEESIRFLRADVSKAPGLNFFDVLERFDVKRQDILRSLRRAEVCEFGPFYIPGGDANGGLALANNCWASFKLYPILDESRSLRECVVRLEDVTERRFVATAISTISTAVSAETGQAFFSRLVVHLARLLQTKYIFIGLSASRQQTPGFQTVAACIDGELVDNLFIPVDGTPLEAVLRKGEYAFAHGELAAQKDQPFLQEFQVSSFVGVAIADNERQSVGAILIMDTAPMEQMEHIRDLAKIFVSRVGNELERLESERTIRKMAFEDPLTGLPNRAELNEQVRAKLSLPGTSAFIQIDLDHFKTINDALGHDVGDDVIKQLGWRLREAADESMFIARLGGDEFAVVISNLEESPERHTIGCANQLLRLLEKPVEVGDHVLDVGCTMGIVLFPEFADTPVDVFRNADIALHKAKQHGRGGFQFFTPAMRDEISQRVCIEKGLREALVRDEFSLYYQPQMDADGEVMGAEVLLRWLTSDSKFISPAVFIPVAEETGLINPIGDWVLRKSLQVRKQWLESVSEFKGHFSINVSAWQFARPDFVESTLGAIAEIDLPANLITLEITETAVLSDIRDTIAKMAELREAGLTIALDDFGTGYSSLAYLRDLPLDSLKIDKTFVDLLEEQTEEPLVGSMISIGEYMGMQVVAEGVESQKQFERLKRMGCNAFQGYLFAKPLSETEFIAWLRQPSQDAAESPELEATQQKKLHQPNAGQN